MAIHIRRNRPVDDMRVSMSFQEWKDKNRVRLSVIFTEYNEITQDKQCSFNEFCVREYKLTQAKKPVK